jgi:tRNA pseudouridine55 synthase
MDDGILLVDKPQGISSHDVVLAIRRMTGLRRVGHTGTLDPHASGLLILCLGRATKFAQFLEGLNKSYWTVMRLGIRTNTQDGTGTIISCHHAPLPSRDQVEAVLCQFTGLLQQIPPMYSALRHQGQRLYRLARQGLTVSRQPRKIFVQRLDLLDIRQEDVTLAVTCSKGTYIRTLCEDIGLALGCGAYMACLQRCQIGPFYLSQAFSLTAIYEYAQHGCFTDLVIPLADAFSFLPSLLLTAQQYEALRHGRRNALAAILDLINELQAATCYRVYTKSDGPLAIMHQLSSSPQRWRLQYFDTAVLQKLCKRYSGNASLDVS